MNIETKVYMYRYLVYITCYYRTVWDPWPVGPRDLGLFAVIGQIKDFATSL